MFSVNTNKRQKLNPRAPFIETGGNLSDLEILLIKAVIKNTKKKTEALGEYKFYPTSCLTARTVTEKLNLGGKTNKPKTALAFEEN